MMNLYKQILVVALCLILITIIIPAPASAENESLTINDIITEEYVPGEVMVTLYEPYYSVDDEVYGDLSDILPEIEIESYKDSYLCFLTEAQRKTLSKDKPEYAALVGQSFLIKLVDKTPEATEVAVEALKNNPYVKWAELNYYGCVDDAIPNDPKYAPASGTPQWGLPRIGAPEAWDYITGSDATDGSELDDYVKVAVIDTGVDALHEDLADNLDMSLAYNTYLDLPGNIEDYYGHGTHVAGIIGAVGNNNKGITGVCWKVDIVPIKITIGTTGSTTYDALKNAINYANYYDIMIANTSIKIEKFNDQVIAAVRNYSNSGGLLIKSAGNNHNDIDSNTAFQELSSIPGVIIVGALGYDENNPTVDMIAGFSNFGASVVDLFAPGEEILSTYIGDEPYEYLDGTSMATPFVTGTAALIKSANTSYTGTSIKKRILDNVTTSSNLTTYCSTGGRLNIPDALYDMGYRVIISNTMTHGTVRPSAVFTKPNTIVYLTAYPDAGYMLKPGTMKHNSNNTYQISKWRCFCAMPYMDDTITAQFYMVGDIDFDEAITVADALVALRHYAGTGILTGDAFLAADVDGDGDVDYDDAQTIQSFAAHMIDHFPIEE